MKIIGKVDNYGNLIVQVHKAELAKLCGEQDADKINVADSVRELDNVSYDRSNVLRTAKGLREAADRLEKLHSIKLVERPARKTSR